jgi:hypothetical protein
LGFRRDEAHPATQTPRLHRKWGSLLGFQIEGLRSPKMAVMGTDYFGAMPSNCMAFVGRSGLEATPRWPASNNV